MLNLSFVDMNISLIPRAANVEGIAIEKLAGNATLSDQDKLGEASRQFEAVLIRQILTNARKPVFTTSLKDQSASAGIYDDMVTGQLADSISRSGDLGLAKSLIGDLTAKSA